MVDSEQADIIYAPLLIDSPQAAPQDVDPVLVYCWPNFCDAGPTANQHWVNMSCLLGLGAPHIPPSQTGDPILVYLGFGLVEMAISTNPKPTIYRNLYENTGPGGLKPSNHQVQYFPVLKKLLQIEGAFL